METKEDQRTSVTAKADQDNPSVKPKVQYIQKEPHRVEALLALQDQKPKKMCL